MSIYEIAAAGILVFAMGMLVFGCYQIGCMLMIMSAQALILGK